MKVAHRVTLIKRPVSPHFAVHWTLRDKAAQRELSALFGRSVDLVPRAGLKPVIAESVLKEAEPLYAD